MCVDEVYIRKLAADAFEWQRLGLKLPGSAGGFNFSSGPSFVTLTVNVNESLSLIAMKSAF